MILYFNYYIILFITNYNLQIDNLYSPCSISCANTYVVSGTVTGVKNKKFYFNNHLRGQDIRTQRDLQSTFITVLYRYFKMIIIRI